MTILRPARPTAASAFAHLCMLELCTAIGAAVLFERRFPSTAAFPSLEHLRLRNPEKTYRSTARPFSL